jgi:hypothetical protein
VSRRVGRFGVHEEGLTSFEEWRWDVVTRANARSRAQHGRVSEVVSASRGWTAWSNRCCLVDALLLTPVSARKTDRESWSATECGGGCWARRGLGRGVQPGALFSANSRVPLKQTRDFGEGQLVR